MWSAIFNKFSYPRTVTDVLADEMIRVGDDMFADDTEIIAMDTPAIILEFVVELAYAGDVPADVLADVRTPLEFTLSALWEESMPFCWAAASCWPTIIMDCPHALQAYMPSYQVCWSLVLPAPPQLLNHEPPRPQQLLFPDFAMMPHLGHTEVMVVVVAGGGFYADIGQTYKEQKTL